MWHSNDLRKYIISPVRQTQPIIKKKKGNKKHSISATTQNHWEERPFNPKKQDDDCKPILSVPAETNQNDSSCPLPPLLSNTNFVFEKKAWCIGITGSLLVFYLVATGTDKEPAIFAAAVVIGRLCGGISVSFTQCLSPVFKCLKDSFQHSRLLFRMKATVESFRFACSCGYPTSYKQGDFLPRFPLLNQVEAWHPSQLWPLRALMLQLCLVLLTTHCSEIAFLLLRPQQATSTLSQLGACQHAPLGSTAFFFC